MLDPMVVMKLSVKVPSENRNSKQLLPTPEGQVLQETQSTRQKRTAVADKQEFDKLVVVLSNARHCRTPLFLIRRSCGQMSQLRQDVFIATNGDDISIWGQESERPIRLEPPAPSS